MRVKIISTFVAIAMVAAVFLAWAPESKAGASPDPGPTCCEPQLEQADCFCGSKYGVREVPCTYDAVCNALECSTGVWECNIKPRKCYWYEEGKVLRRFIEYSAPEQLLNCDCEDICEQ